MSDGSVSTVELNTMRAPKVNVTVGVTDERVILRFDREVSWLEMDPVTAIKVAETMKEKAIGILRE